jgi:hypothetical protein
VEILEPPPIPVIDLVTDSEDEVAPSSTPPKGDVVPMVASEDLESEVELLREIETLTYPGRSSVRQPGWLEEKLSWAGVKCERWLRELKASLERPRRVPKHFGYSNGRDVDITKRTGGFYELGLSPDRKE